MMLLFPLLLVQAFAMQALDNVLKHEASFDNITLRDFDESSGSWKDVQKLRGWPQVPADWPERSIPQGNVLFDSKNGIYIVPFVANSQWDNTDNHSTWFVLWKRGNPKSFATLGPVKKLTMQRLVGGESGTAYALFKSKSLPRERMIVQLTTNSPSLSPAITVTGPDWAGTPGWVPATYLPATSQLVLKSVAEQPFTPHLFFVDVNSGAVVQGFDFDQSELKGQNIDLISLPTTGSNLAAVLPSTAYMLHMKTGKVSSSLPLCPGFYNPYESFLAGDRVQGKGYWFGRCDGQMRSMIYTVKNGNWTSPAIVKPYTPVTGPVVDVY